MRKKALGRTERDELSDLLRQLELMPPAAGDVVIHIGNDPQRDVRYVSAVEWQRVVWN